MAAISDHFDADRLRSKVSNVTTGIRWARETLKRSLEMCSEPMTFDEMLRAPVQRRANPVLRQRPDRRGARQQHATDFAGGADACAGRQTVCRATAASRSTASTARIRLRCK
jgi:hypothetical protein